MPAYLCQLLLLLRRPRRGLQDGPHVVADLRAELASRLRLPAWRSVTSRYAVKLPVYVPGRACGPYRPRSPRPAHLQIRRKRRLARSVSAAASTVERARPVFVRARVTRRPGRPDGRPRWSVWPVQFVLQTHTRRLRRSCSTESRRSASRRRYRAASRGSGRVTLATVAHATPATRLFSSVYVPAHWLAVPAAWTIEPPTVARAALASVAPAGGRGVAGEGRPPHGEGGVPWR